MKAENVRKILIFDQGDPVALQLLGKAEEVFGDSPEYVLVRARRTHNIALAQMEKAISVLTDLSYYRREMAASAHLPF